MGEASAMKKEISLKTCKKRLAALWFTMGPIIVLLLVVISLLGKKLGDKADEAWGWFLPTVMPTLSLIIGVLVVDATDPQKTEKKVDRFLFWLAFDLSFFYLAIVVLTILIQPFTGSTLLDLMKASNLWLGPVQGLVAAVLGAFFIKGERGK